MAIDYDFYEASNLKAAKCDVYARPVGGQTVTTEQLARFIEKGTTATRGDIRLVLSALADEIVFQLREGNRVQVDDLGTFSIAMEGQAGRDRNGRLLLKGARIRSVRFRPCRQLMQKMGSVQFTRSNHLGHHSARVSQEEVLAAVDRMTQGGGTFTVARFRSELGLSGGMAYKWLRQLAEDGVVSNVGARNCAVYVRKEGQRDS
ncbi:MAG: HU family DNA-binding protein [Bacteroidaceae bacterium]|nr:HU family DNA-binding protein [Bacteroidaceae bacterium]